MKLPNNTKLLMINIKQKQMIKHKIQLTGERLHKLKIKVSVLDAGHLVL